MVCAEIVIRRSHLRQNVTILKSLIFVLFAVQMDYCNIQKTVNEQR